MSIATRLHPFDLEAEGFDLAIHFGRPDWPDATPTLLCDETMIAVAAPGFIRAHALDTAENLTRAPRLALASRPLAWEQWFRHCQLDHSPRAPAMEFDRFNMIITAACQAMGMALLPQYLIERELDSGALAALGMTPMKTPNSYYIMRPRGDSAGPVSQFIENLVGWVSEDGGKI
ncbi:MAG TPA: hypothetical protein ENK41_01980 [Rhodobacteraceae bacterium]|nr:hypothetical protein [Paracoccaceae bacterium]